MKGPSIGTRILLLGLLALGLIVADQRLKWFQPVEEGLSLLATPFYWLADIPERLKNWGSDTLVSRQTLVEENLRLRNESLILKAKVQKMAALAAENTRLRELLNSSALLNDTVLVAELINVAPDPLRHQVVINKGADDDVFVGQPVIDAHGLVGQVTEVSQYFSRVLLITDTTQAVPVQVNRNGVRAIAEGSGRLDELRLLHVAATTDIKVGDLLVSSGLGSRYPEGYPVASVVAVEEDPGLPFLNVSARPSAHLDRSRHLLLVFKEERTDAGSED